LLQRAGRRPPEYAALEAAVGAINKVLAINSKIRGGGSGSADGSASGSSARGNSDASSAREAARGAREEAAALARSDPGKLVTLKARASGSKDVTVRVRAGTTLVVRRWRSQWLHGDPAAAHALPARVIYKMLFESPPHGPE
jgi:hypothetical protein